ncbi:alcohol dehydrogenase [Asanoa ferruginea]|uniref:Alcohol dehydrogenase n=1 Tax=Asanoa ferruginea TaxID=53367 RepID=A0A3D9ZLP2_9ACTN|nr:zinc-dependent alcohol dehydrogenase family protein [Asanoa ferruginea]REF98131.1 alcohol dehydrogenase [Asanoa ferruginea]GIF53733.1 alcohol dehydrogenase [Asanoa ferruginea]
MRAVYYEAFGSPPEVRELPDPTPPPGGAVISVSVTGLCRSDWHGWRGHDPDIVVPHVPGHEFAGVVTAVGTGVARWRPGDRVTVPFICACGHCPSCLAGDQQVCSNQSQPGFTRWGSFAELVAVEHADVNLVRLPDSVSDTAAVSLGCRFGTAFRAVVHQGRVAPGEWVAVHGCGGVGLSAVMVAAAAGARVIAVDIAPRALELAALAGAAEVLDASSIPGGPAEVAAAVRDRTDGGAHLSLDALGSSVTCVTSIECLRRRGRHIQVGLLPAVTGRPALPMDRVIAYELELRGSHGLPAHAFPEMLRLIEAGKLRPDELVTDDLTLDEAPAALISMVRAPVNGIRLIRPRAAGD